MSISFTPSMAHAVSVAVHVIYDPEYTFSEVALRDAVELRNAFNTFCDGMKAYRRGELPLSEVRELHAVTVDRAITFQASSGLELGLFGL